MGTSMRSWKHTVVIDRLGKSHKLCKIMYGRDGTYMVTCPYHPEKKALLHMSTMNFDVSPAWQPLGAAIEIAALDDDKQRLKLTHHPDGWLQFSGHGVLSGRKADGTAKGLGIQSWPLAQPVPGPSFGLVFRGIETFSEAKENGSDAVRFVPDEQFDRTREDALVLEGYYMHALWRRFLIRKGDSYDVHLIHPAGAVLPVRAVLPPPECALGGFIGLTLTSLPKVEGVNPSPSPSFMLSSSTGNVRRNEYGQLLGDGLHCMYPAGDYPVRKSMNYVPPQLDTRSIPAPRPEPERVGRLPLEGDGRPGG